MKNENANHNIVITCGGTGGHIYPGIALAQHRQKKVPNAAIIFLGSANRLESQIIPKYGFQFYAVTPDARKIMGLCIGLFKALYILKKYRITQVLATGGAVTVPVIVAAACWRIPIILYEQNAKPGRVNRYFQYLSREVHVSFKQSIPYFKANKVKLTGNPVRQRYLEDDLFHQIKPLTFPKDMPVLLCFGGSQGADAINQLIYANYAFFLKENIALIHVSGPTFFKHFFSSSSEQPYNYQTDTANQLKILTIPYFENMKWLYETATWVLCRAGATTIAELQHFKKPGILVPYPFAKDNHQVDNAQAAQELGIGRMILQEDLTFEAIIKTLPLLQHPRDSH